jgi:hypothetical protein
MKNDYKDGGMSITDTECLNRALKLRQFIRAKESGHEIAKIQAFLTGSQNIINEYCSITNLDPISESAQGTINILMDYNRSVFEQTEEEIYENDTLIINEVSSINLVKYFRRQKKDLISCLLIPITNGGINTLGELIQTYEHENDETQNKRMETILKYIPKNLIKIAKCFNENINSDNEKVEYIMTSPQNWTNISEITVKQLQIVLKTALNKVEKLDFDNKLGIIGFDTENVINFRQKCKNPKLRNIYFRLIHNDFFTHSRMKRYRMTTTDKCPRCGETEDSRHLTWECSHSRKIWDLYNSLMAKSNMNCEKVELYEDVFKPGKTTASCLIKIRVIQEMIQIERPKNWKEENITNICRELMKIENYNSKEMKTLPKFIEKWKFFFKT